MPWDMLLVRIRNKWTGRECDWGMGGGSNDGGIVALLLLVPVSLNLIWNWCIHRSGYSMGKVLLFNMLLHTLF